MSIVTSKEALLNLSINKQFEIIRKVLSKDETDDMKTSIANNLMALKSLENELDEIKASYKAKMKPLQKEMYEILNAVNNGFIDNKMEVFLVPDYDNRIMEFYNEEGDKVGDRKMMMSEIQGSLGLK